MKYLVFGSHGFIGGRLCRELEEVIEGDRDLVNVDNVDHIVDLASYGNMAWQTEKDEIYKANLFRPFQILLNSKGFKSFILTSTSAIQQEGYNDYILAKGMMEKAVLFYASKTGLPITIIRPASVIGVGEQKEHLIPKLIRSCLYGEEMDFVEEPTHDYISVSDVVSAIIHIQENIDKCKGKYFNISSGKGYSNLEIKRMVEIETGMRANIKINNNFKRPYDGNNWVVNNGELKRLGWQPKEPIEQTICKMVYEEKSSK